MRDLDKEYTQLDGLEDFTQATASLLLGERNSVLSEVRCAALVAPEWLLNVREELSQFNHWLEQEQFV